MNKTAFTLAAVLLFAGAVAAQTVATPGGMGYFGNEPNVVSPGSLPYAYHQTDFRVSDYPADKNGMAVARLGGEPAQVLGAALYPRNSIGVGVFRDTHVILSPFTGGDYLLPVVPHQFLAWRGTWTDLNQDGWLTHEGMTGGVIYVDAASGRDCGDQAPDLADEDGGVGATPPGMDRISTGVAYRCHGADEWVGKNDETVVAYMSPHVHTQIYPGNTLTAAQGRNPDFTFSNVGAATEGGRYFAPDSNFMVFFVDNSVLETTVTETIANPVVTTEGPRSRVVGDNSLVDTDIYRSVDPLLEGLYQETVVRPYTELGCDLDHPERTAVFDWCPGPFWTHYNATLGSTVNETIRTVNNANTITGPPQAKFLPPVRTRTAAFDYTEGPHLFFDVRLETTNRWHAVATANNPTVGPVSGTGSGEAQAWAQTALFGRLGVWHDKTGDGWIGNPSKPEGCEDGYLCGARQDPHQYNNTSEFTGVCRPDVRLGEIMATLESSTGNWGELGVYVASDHWHTDSVLDPDYDRYQADGRASFNPWDDAVIDVLGLDGSTTGEVNRLVTEGPIDLHLVCGATFGIGRYYSYESLYWPTSNIGFDIYLTTEAVEFAFASAGVETPETVQIVDAANDPHLRAWHLPSPP